MQRRRELLGPEKSRVRPASNPYQGHTKVSGLGRARRAAVVVEVAVVDGCVNCTLGCDTFPGACSRTKATRPPATSRTAPTPMSPRRSRRRDAGLGMAAMVEMAIVLDK